MARRRRQKKPSGAQKNHANVMAPLTAGQAQPYFGNSPPAPMMGEGLGEIAWADPYWLVGGLGSFIPYNPSRLVTTKGLNIYDEMRRDDQIKAALVFKKRACIGTGWDVDPPEGADETDEATKFIKDNLDQIEGTLESALFQVMSSLDYGFSVTEKVYGEKDGKIWLIALKSKKPHPFRFNIDSFGNLLGLIQVGNNAYLPPEKFIVHRHLPEFGNPYGTSDLDAAYRPWWAKDNTYKWLCMLLEQFGVPPVVAMYNSAAYKQQEVSNLTTILNRLQASTKAAIPRTNKDDLELWSPELAGQVSTTFVPALDMMNRDIARAILMPGLLGITPEGSQAGSFARAKVIFDVFEYEISGLRQDLENLINVEIVEPLMALNFGTSGEDCPHFHFLPVTEEDKNAQIDEFVKAVQFGAMTVQPEDEDHIRAILEFPEQNAQLDMSDYAPNNPGSPDNGPLPVGEEPNQNPSKSGFGGTAGMTQRYTNENDAALVRELLGRKQALLDAIQSGDNPDVANLARDHLNQMDWLKGWLARHNEPDTTEKPKDETDTPDPNNPNKGQKIVPDSRYPGIEDQITPVKNPPGPKKGDSDGFSQKVKKKDYRDLTEAEVKTNVARLGPVLDQLEANAIKNLRKILVKSRDTLVKRFRQNLPTALQIRTMQVPGKVGFSRGLQASFKAAFDAGRSTLRQDTSAPKLKRFAGYDPASYSPQSAIDYLTNKAITVAGVTNDQLLAAIQNSLLFSLKTGESTSAAVSRLADAFDPFIGNDQVLGPDGEPLAPYRLENIVRTNTTDAFNQGRLTEARQFGIDNMQYSAILDTRTTEVCRFLDGKVFPLDSPELSALTPPNHYNCRSVLVPLTADVQVSQDQMITPADVGEAKSLAGKSFI